MLGRLSPSGLAMAEPYNVIAVPGSTSNLGPAFDALAVALDLHLRIRVLDVRADPRRARSDTSSRVQGPRAKTASTRPISWPAAGSARRSWACRFASPARSRWLQASAAVRPPRSRASISTKRRARHSARPGGHAAAGDGARGPPGQRRRGASWRNHPELSDRPRHPRPIVAMAGCDPVRHRHAGRQPRNEACARRDAVAVPLARCGREPAARAAADPRARNRRLRRHSRGPEGPLAPAGAERHGAGARRVPRDRSSSGAGRLPERRRAVRPRASPRRDDPKKLRPSSPTSTAASACRTPSGISRLFSPQPSILHRQRNEREPHEFQPSMSPVRDEIPCDSLVGLRPVPRPARGHLRLCRRFARSSRAS